MNVRACGWPAMKNAQVVSFTLLEFRAPAMPARASTGAHRGTPKRRTRNNRSAALLPARQTRPRCPHRPARSRQKRREKQTWPRQTPSRLFSVERQRGGIAGDEQNQTGRQNQFHTHAARRMFLRVVELPGDANEPHRCEHDDRDHAKDERETLVMPEGSPCEVQPPTVFAERWLHICWAESERPMVSPPAHKGFGTQLLERAVARELGAEVQLRFLPRGVVCRIEAPLP